LGASRFRGFLRGRFREGLEAFSVQGCIAWSASLDESRAARISQYRNDTISARGKRFIFAYTNEEARRLNDAIQDLEIERGRVRNLSHFGTDNGALRIGEGDRIVFRSTDKKRGIVNGLFASAGRDGRVRHAQAWQLCETCSLANDRRPAFVGSVFHR
jgi:hypothetical protein